jgi:hypothetical protein
VDDAVREDIVEPRLRGGRVDKGEEHGKEQREEQTAAAARDHRQTLARPPGRRKGDADADAKERRVRLNMLRRMTFGGSVLTAPNQHCGTGVKTWTPATS